MAGKYIIVADERGYQGGLADGGITKENINKLIYSNCSGRAFKNKPTMLYMKEEIKKYNVEQGAFNRDYALKNLNLKHQVDKILQLKKWENQN